MRSHFAFSLALAAFCSVTLPLASAQSDSSSGTYPQIVRITHVEGDVRVSRGREGGAPKNVDWEKAVDGLPVQEGFSLATGDGRAEIEFQDASTIYLAPNSVLLFDDLESTSLAGPKVFVHDIPQTEISLLTGTATLAVKLAVAGELFVLRTPTDTLSVPFGKQIRVRVTSYMDAVALTPLAGGFVQVGSSTQLVAPAARTLYYKGGSRIDYIAGPSDVDLKDWDRWVDDRISHRDTAMAAMLKQTGLKEPIPGLAQLDGQGKFVDCPGYGTCWQPPAPAQTTDQTATNGQPALVPVKSAVGSDARPIVFSATDNTPPSVARSGSPQQNDGFDSFGMFPCGPGSAFYQYSMFSPFGYSGYGYMGIGYNGYGSMGGYNPLMAGYLYSATPWDWAVCHSGGWIYQGNQYLWVPGRFQRYQPPVRWVRIGHNVGFVPLNPKDVNGKAPINQVNGIFTVNDKNGFHVGRISATPGAEVKVLNEAPREFRKTVSLPLARTDSPHMEAHMLQPGLDKLGIGKEGPAHSGTLNAGAPGSKSGEPKTSGLRTGAPGAAMPIVFDHRSQSFMMSHEVVQGGNIRTVNEPVGSYIERSGGTFGGRAGFQGEAGFRGTGPVGGGNSGAGFRGSGMINGGGGGASRGGGGGYSGGTSSAGSYSGGGGASHGGGGGGFSPSAGGGAAPSGGGSAPSGGGHK